MKLVDILARELKVWPEGVDSVWQSSCDNEIYFDTDVPPFYTSLNAEDSGTQGAVITQAQWQAAVDALNAPKVVEWPELSETVEVIKGPAEWSDEQIDMIGHQGKVRSIFKNDFDQKIVAIELSSGECKCFIVECIKPVHTAEQVAAEEREKAIGELVDVYEAAVLKQSYDTRGVIAAIYDAGYRKEPKPCGS